MRASEINSIESESGVIATLIRHPDFVFLSEQLLPNHFTDKENKCVYTAICDLAKRGIETIDPYNIIEDLNSSEATRKFAEELSLDGLKELVEMSPILARNTPEEYKMLVSNVLDAAFRRDTYERLKECEQLCMDRTAENIEHRIYQIIDEAMMEYSSTDDVPVYGDILDETWAEIEARQKGEIKTIDFPFPALNDYVVMEPGEVICFTGAAKSGKSAMLLTCTVDLLKKGKSVLYIDSEISTRLFTVRLLSHLTGIKFADLRSGNYSDQDAERITEALAWLKTRKFIHRYLPMFDENTIYLTVMKARHLIDVECVVLDYMKSTGGSSEAFGVYAELGLLADTFKNKICGDLGLVGLTAAQATNTGKIADSARIARSVSTVIAIQDKTVEEIEDHGAKCGNKKLRVVFNRNGAQMMEDESIDMIFRGSLISYEQAPEQHKELQPF